MKVDEFFMKMLIPDNLIYEGIENLKNIPCDCDVDSQRFLIRLSGPFQELTGEVFGWNKKDLQERAPSPVGGKIMFRCNAMISFEAMEGDKYKITDLSFFIPSFPGWFPIISGGQWAEPVCRHTTEELKMIAEFEAEIDARSSKKKNNKKYCSE